MAGAVKTASARAVRDLSVMLDATRDHSPLRHVTEAGEVGDAAAFLASDLSGGITGNVLYVDSGMQTPVVLQLTVDIGNSQSSPFLVKGLPI